MLHPWERILVNASIYNNGYAPICFKLLTPTYAKIGYKIGVATLFP